jgi:hypothetical protein
MVQRPKVADRIQEFLSRVKTGKLDNKIISKRSSKSLRLIDGYWKMVRRDRSLAQTIFP